MVVLEVLLLIILLLVGTCIGEHREVLTKESHSRIFTLTIEGELKDVPEIRNVSKHITFSVRE